MWDLIRIWKPDWKYKNQLVPTVVGKVVTHISRNISFIKSLFHSFRLGRYRMPFAWAARPLFRPSGELDTTSDISTIYRQESHRNSEEDLIKTLSDFRRFFHKWKLKYQPFIKFLNVLLSPFRPEKLNRLTIIPGVIRITVEHLKEAIPSMRQILLFH